MTRIGREASAIGIRLIECSSGRVEFYASFMRREWLKDECRAPPGPPSALARGATPP